MFAHLVNEVSRDVACAVCTQEIQALLDEHRLVAQFRPVADFQQCVIAGYIATVPLAIMLVVVSLAPFFRKVPSPR